jgi:hypothetical protein
MPHSMTYEAPHELVYTVLFKAGQRAVEEGRADVEDEVVEIVFTLVETTTEPVEIVVALEPLAERVTVLTVLGITAVETTGDLQSSLPP